MYPLHRETHLIERIGWLRAAVLGANDGIISTSSLVVGVAAASTSPSEVLVAGVAGWSPAQLLWQRGNMSR
jgi:vacuolar iron transporter family protein